jgi:hypothetical protein
MDDLHYSVVDCVADTVEAAFCDLHDALRYISLKAHGCGNRYSVNGFTFAPEALATKEQRQDAYEMIPLPLPLLPIS